MRVRLAIGTILLGAILLAGLIARVWTPWPIDLIDVPDRLAPASAMHLLGTDQLGRDLLSLLMAGTLPALATAALAVAIGMGLGVPLGLVAATASGRLDEALARLGDLLFGFPAVVLALLVVVLLGPGAWQAGVAIGIVNVPVFLRVTRSAARRLWRADFVAAARLADAGPLRIAATHLLPNIAELLLVQATSQFGIALGAQAALAYLGLGPQPPAASWGRMLAEGQSLVTLAPRLMLLPALALCVTILAVNLLAGALAERRR